MTRTPSNHSRRGVALVVTIGLLAVLILVVVAFSISMRVERLAARNYSDVIQARQWAQSALSTAMTDLEAFIGNQPLMPDADHVWPDSAAGVRLYSGAATNYVPAALHSAANVDVPWKNATINGKTVARYAYQVLDCSGFIDANFAGLTNVPGTRGVASNAMNIWLDASVLSEMVAGRESEIKRGLNFTGFGSGANTSPWNEYPTPADLWQTLGNGSALGAGILDNRPSDFFTYSRFPPGYANAASLTFVTNPIFLGFNQTYFNANKSAIQQAILTELKTLPAILEPETLAANIIDYCDADDKPSGPTSGAGSVRDSFSMEATPLINEFLLEITLRSAGSGTYQLECKPYMECWYPFVGYTNKGIYNVQILIQFEGDANYTHTKNTGLVAMSAPGGSWDYNDLVRVDILPYTLPLAGTTALPNSGSLVVSLTAVVISPTDGIVDTIVQRKVRITAPPQVVGEMKTVGIAIDDPRYNAVAYGKWVETGNGISAPNSKQSLLPLAAVNTNIMTAATGPDSDFRGTTINPWIFWPNRVMQTAGELGLQGYNPQKAWHTIPLLGSAAAAVPVLDRFIANSNVHGRININTWRDEVLRTAFHDAPRNGYPDQSLNKISTTERDNIATAINGQTYKNLSDLSQLPDTIGGLNRLESEGVIRDTAEILGVRQNLFTILVAAQSLTDSGNVMGEQRALAVVWRDPYATVDSAGNRYHPSFVRSFRWLNE